MPAAPHRPVPSALITRRSRPARAALLALALAVAAASCAQRETRGGLQAPDMPTAPRTAGCGPQPGLALIGVAEISAGTEVLGTTFGGISGIDYDAASGQWLLISDDRSALQPARVYTAHLHYTRAALQVPAITGVHTLRHASGAAFASARRPAPGIDVPDAEAVRWLPGGRTFVWTSEGDFARGYGPQLRENRADGAAVRDWPLPPGFMPSTDRHGGPRANATLEGLALTPDGRTAWLAMETAWVQDGPRPAVGAAGGPLRITAIDVDTGRPLRQIAYVPDAVPHARRMPWGPELNGVSEILADGPHHLLVLERAYSAGAGFAARLYRIDTREGTDTLGVDALAPGNHTPVAKQCVADLQVLAGGTLDNLEGMAWGPELPQPGAEAGDGRVIVFVSDDNFNPAQTTQFIAARYLQARPAGPDARPAGPAPSR